MEEQGDLTGKMLIAMPGMTDPRFARSVVLICAHSNEGAMGLVVNRRLHDLEFSDLLSQLGIDREASSREVPVHFGGPVEPARGFVLHPMPGSEEDEGHEGRMEIAPGLAMTTTRDILEELARGEGPECAVLALGYAGWGPGQLEAEMLANGWLTTERNDELLFGGNDPDKWAQAIRGLGVDPSLLSQSAGRA